ncbi:MAG TPA: glycogen/starch synthase [Sedimentisphaerales bacterium]|nr:glycogen/starch synthase [Sedimentisphaerales bacterium]
MPLLTLCFQLHQPFRLSPEGTSLFWDEKNREIFARRAERCYVPAIQMFSDLVHAHYDFKVCLSLSGTFIEQAELYQPQVLDALKGLLHLGRDTRQVEFLEQPYYSSYASFFADPRKTEFKEQVSLHRQKMHDIFGVKPTAFANTGLSYNNEIANIVADMGFRAILCQPTDKTVDVRSRTPILANEVHRAIGRKGRPRKLAVLPRNANLSRRLAHSVNGDTVSATQYADLVHEAGGEVMVLYSSFPLVETGTPAYEKMAQFWRSLAEEITSRTDIVPANPTEIAEWFQITECPMVDCPDPTDSLPETMSGQAGTPPSHAQWVLFRNIESLENEAKRAGGDLVRRFRYLTTSDHLQYLREGGNGPDLTGDPTNPYDSVATATYALTHAIDELFHSVRSFNILKKSARTPVIVVTPETGRLPSEGMGQFAKYVSGKSGGLGEVISALCKGLSERRIPVHLITLNLSRRFREEAGLSEAEWTQTRHHLNPENIHLVSSAIYERYRSAYDGSPLENAAEFQKQIVNTYIKEIRSAYEGRAILHCNDWMAGGIITAYAKLRGVPVLHTVHNTHTGHVPLNMFYGVNVQALSDKLYMSLESREKAVDCQATAIRNATKVSYVGEKFLKEVVGDFFLWDSVMPWSVREETKARYYGHDTLVIPNGISPDMYPENQEENPAVDQRGLARRYGPSDNVLEAKRANLIKFQQKTGLRIDPDAILLYWPSRLDPVQKGIDLLEKIAQKLVDDHPGVQIAVIGDPVGWDNWHADVMGRIAYASRGMICYQRFSHDLSILGYAAASDVFGASLYEPFGQIDVVGNIYGATATNRDTGGYSDKIVPLALRAWGAPIDHGNGVLFRDYDANGLLWGLKTTIQHHRYFREHPREWEKQMRRIMKEARHTWSLENMVAKYITAYEELNGGKPLG